MPVALVHSEVRSLLRNLQVQLLSTSLLVLLSLVVPQLRLSSCNSCNIVQLVTLG
jgi:hypothetical protein